MDPLTFRLVSKGTKLNQDEQGALIRDVCCLASADPRAYQAMSDGSASRMFPGAQPVSITEESLEKTMNDDYHVSEKTDGTRFLLYIRDTRSNVGEKDRTHIKGQVINDKAKCYLVGREWEIIDLNLSLPLTSRNLTSLLDGELVSDMTKEGEKRLVLYVFDALFVAGQSVVRETLVTRLNSVKYLFKGRQNLYARKKKGMKVDEDMLRFEVAFTQARHRRAKEGHPDDVSFVVKHFMPKSEIKKMFDEVIPRLPHRNDGVILTPSKDPYKAGTCPRLLKWKPADQNSVDFMVGRKHIVVEIKNDDGTFRQETRILATLYLAKDGQTDFTEGGLTNVDLTPGQVAHILAVDKKREKDDSRPPYLTDTVVEAVYVPDWHLTTYKKVDRVSVDDSGKEHKRTVWVVDSVLDGGWRIERERPDKALPNDIKTYNKVFMSIQQAITKETLIDRLEARPLVAVSGEGLPSLPSDLVKAAHAAFNSYQLTRVKPAPKADRLDLSAVTAALGVHPVTTTVSFGHVAEVSDFIRRHVVHAAHTELEMRLGVIRWSEAALPPGPIQLAWQMACNDAASRKLPAPPLPRYAHAVDAVVAAKGTYFDSGVTQLQYRLIKAALNAHWNEMKGTQEGQAEGYSVAKSLTEDLNFRSLGDKIRVSYPYAPDPANPRGKKIIAVDKIFCMKKQRTDKLDIRTSGKTDIRLASSVEEPMELPAALRSPKPDEPLLRGRRKLRTSFRTSGWSLDLTEVRELRGVDKGLNRLWSKEATFEVELEVTPNGLANLQGASAIPAAFFQQCADILQQARVLVERCGSTWDDTPTQAELGRVRPEEEETVEAEATEGQGEAKAEAPEPNQVEVKAEETTKPADAPEVRKAVPVPAEKRDVITMGVGLLVCDE
ncbi:mRNA capping enzyme, catalytic domain [Carpediemonas membranifera]|uniref:mRNA capping enzyme, catalytic domain n=1 Tax=Carpediemonas membranifera TaxID=201153 RepID=A0A8J6AY05_9EUKA|nr:mRNA capping enzyme, catalytic domain [Carpediemonas membranifera]|eukprot:KAG9397636.1 mRNA capping enzyme, catalytic domain [Carpediemonas membranifera]